MKCPKPKTWRSKEYLNHIRGYQCVACLSDPPSEAHHFSGMGNKGTAHKCQDSQVIPFCGYCHRAIHNDPKRFLKEHNLSERYLYFRMIQMMTDWLQKGGIKWKNIQT